jgi:hypothetical protein
MFLLDDQLPFAATTKCPRQAEAGIADLLSFSRDNPTEKQAHAPQKILMLNSWKPAVLSAPAEVAMLSSTEPSIRSARQHQSLTG